MTIDDVLIVLTVAVAGLLVATVPKIPVTLFVLGALMPVWSIGPIPPDFFDAARYGLAAIIAGRLWLRPGVAEKKLASWTTSLAVVGILMVLFQWLRGDSTIEGIIVIFGALLAWLVVSRVESVWPIFFGFAVGATVSAIVLLGTSAGVGPLAALVPNQNPGYGRLTGLGTSAVRVSIELAIALVIWCAAWAMKKAQYGALVGVPIVALALLASGGRTGVAGLIIVIVIATLRGWIRPVVALFMTPAVIGVIYYADQRTSFSTLERFRSEDATGGLGFDNGRLSRLSDAWDSWMTSPFIGGGVSDAHFAPLFFASTGGIVAGVIIIVLMARLIVLPFRAVTTAEGVAGALIGALFAVTAFLEPLGPFLGFESVTLMFCCIVAVSRSSQPQPEPDVETPQKADFRVRT